MARISKIKNGKASTFWIGSISVNQLRQLSYELEKTRGQIIEEALNDYFDKHQ